MEESVLILEILYFLGRILIRLGYYTIKIITLKKYPKFQCKEAEKKMSGKLLLTGILVFLAILFAIF